MYYILEGREPKAVELHEWALWFEKSKVARRVAADKVGDIRVSTVFLGLDHSYGEGPPLLFETMIFGGVLDQDQERCSTWAEAEAMHQRALERVRASLP